MNRVAANLPTFARWFGAESRRSLARGARRAATALYVLALVIAGLWLVARLIALAYIRSTVRDFEAAHGSIDPRSRPPLAGRSADDAGPFYRAAIELTPRVAARKYRAWENAALAADLRMLEEQVEALGPDFRWPTSLLEEGAKRRHCQLLPQRLTVDASLGFDALAPLDLARHRLSVARLDLEAGRLEEAQRGIHSVLGLADCMQAAEPVLLQLLGTSIERRALRLSALALQRGSLDSQLEAFERRLSAPGPDPATRMKAMAFMIGPRSEAPERMAPWRTAGSLWVADVLLLPELRGAFWLAHQQRVIAALHAAAPLESVSWPERLDGPDLVEGGVAEWLYARRERATAAERFLLRAAVIARSRGIALGVYPTSPEDAGLTGNLPRSFLADEDLAWSNEADGSLTLALPANRAAWKSLFPLYDMLPQDPEFFEFGPIRLPPLQPRR